MIPLLFIGIAAVTGAAGIGETVKAGFDLSKSSRLNANTEERLTYAANMLDHARKQCEYSLEELGKEKLFALNGSIRTFVDLFSQLKNVDFRNSIGLEELEKLHIDHFQFEELKAMSNVATSIVGGTVAGAAGGAMAALGAYGAASTFATASTGTAISALSGAAAHNATLAFFGGGSLATGGLGMAGGTAVLGGLVAGPALLVMGTIVGLNAGKNLENAKAKAAEATQNCVELENGTFQCIAIRRRTYMFYSLLARLDAQFTPLLFEMKHILETEGTDYSRYLLDSKKVIAQAASMAGSIKSILDTPILTEEGNLTDESEELVKNC